MAKQSAVGYPQLASDPRPSALLAKGGSCASGVPCALKRACAGQRELLTCAGTEDKTEILKRILRSRTAAQVASTCARPETLHVEVALGCLSVPRIAQAAAGFSGVDKVRGRGVESQEEGSAIPDDSTQSLASPSKAELLMWQQQSKRKQASKTPHKSGRVLASALTKPSAHHGAPAPAHGDDVNAEIKALRQVLILLSGNSVSVSAFISMLKSRAPSAGGIGTAGSTAVEDRRKGG